MVNDYLITSGDFIASSNIEHPIQFSILHYQNLWGDACFIRVKSWSKTNKNIHWLLWSRNKIPLLGDKKKESALLGFVLQRKSIQQISHYHDDKEKKIQWNYTPSHRQRLSLMLYNSKTWRQQDLQYSNLLDSLDFFNILTLKFLSYLKTFIFRKFIFKPTSQIIQKSWNHLFCVNFTHSFSICCLD